MSYCRFCGKRVFQPSMRSCRGEATDSWKLGNLPPPPFFGPPSLREKYRKNTEYEALFIAKKRERKEGFIQMRSESRRHSGTFTPTTARRSIASDGGSLIPWNRSVELWL